MVTLVSHVRLSADRFAFIQSFDEAAFSNQTPTSFTATFSPTIYANLTASTDSSYIYFSGYPYDGTTDSVDLFIDNELSVEIEDLNLTVSDFIAYSSLTPQEALATILSGNDEIEGSRFSDTIYGFSGDDFINGSKGKDKLFGSHGHDTFYFDEKGSGHRDEIMDWGTDGFQDEIGLDPSTFAAIGAALTRNEFELTNARFTGVERTDHILYIKRTGELFYDQDGGGKKGVDPVLFAEVANNTTLTYRDFEMIRDRDLIDA